MRSHPFAGPSCPRVVYFVTWSAEGSRHRRPGENKFFLGTPVRGVVPGRGRTCSPPATAVLEQPSPGRVAESALGRRNIVLSQSDELDRRGNIKTILDPTSGHNVRRR